MVSEGVRGAVSSEGRRGSDRMCYQDMLYEGDRKGSKIEKMDDMEEVARYPFFSLFVQFFSFFVS